MSNPPSKMTSIETTSKKTKLEGENDSNPNDLRCKSSMIKQEQTVKATNMDKTFINSHKNIPK